MRTCQKCGRENPLDRDFCECGEYLRWEPTNYQMPAVAPPQPPPAGERAAVAPPPARAPGGPPPPRRRCSARAAVSPRGAPAAATGATGTAAVARPRAASGRRRITLRLPQDQARAGDQRVELAVVLRPPRPRPCARAQPERHRRQLRARRSRAATRLVDGRAHRPLYLVPLGVGGRVRAGDRDRPAPAARGVRRGAALGSGGRRLLACPRYGRSRARRSRSASCPSRTMRSAVRPERAAGAQEGDYDVRVTNSANAVVLLALDARRRRRRVPLSLRRADDRRADGLNQDRPAAGPPAASALDRADASSAASRSSRPAGRPARTSSRRRRSATAAARTAGGAGRSRRSPA